MRKTSRDKMKWWPHSKRRLAEINAEMADGIISEVQDMLRPLPCMHGLNHGDNVPGMFLAERIMCIMNGLRREILNLGGQDPFKASHAKD